MQMIKQTILGIWKIFDHRQGFRMAESLSYITLLCIVPVAFIAFSMFASFPAFEETRYYAQHAVLDFLSPEHQKTVSESMNTFLGNAQSLSWQGVIGLIVTALALFFHIEATFETLWGTTTRRNISQRALLFWALLTLGPLVFGASLWLSTIVYDGWYRLGVGSPLIHAFDLFLLHVLGFWLFYRSIPNRHVPARDALIGAVVASVLFKLLKVSFSYYIDNLSSYNTIYGTLATIPVFLLLLYAVWIVVILGACVTVYLEKQPRVHDHSS